MYSTSMSEESFLLVSLEEDKSKKLAQVLSNDTSRRILDLLSKQDLMTETDIAKTLQMPLSTTHYNLGLLVKSGLVNDDNFNYSKKGKKIVHYSLANKYVIIAPKKSVAWEKLKNFLPVTIFIVVISYFINILTKRAPEPMLMGAANTEMMAKAADVVMVSSDQNFSYWFLAGGLAALISYFVWAKLIRKE